MNAEECRQMGREARKTGVLLGWRRFRFEESTRDCGNASPRARIGKLTFAAAEFSFSFNHHARTWINDRSIAGGGPISDVGVHLIDRSLHSADEVQRGQARPDELESGDDEAGDLSGYPFISSSGRADALHLILQNVAERIDAVHATSEMGPRRRWSDH